MATRAEWRQKILDELGGEGTDAGLSEQQLDAALRSALELFNKHRPDRQWFPFDVPSTGASETFIISFFADPERTDPLAHPETYIRNVIDVTFQDVNRMILGPRALGTEGYYLRWGHEGPRLFFQMQSAKRTYERLTGSRPDWTYEKNTRKLYITSPSRPVRCMVLCTRERKLEEVTYDMENDFRQAATAKAKYTLARMLGQFGPIPGATASGNIETDAALLREESKTEWDEIKSKLEAALPSQPPPQYIG
jgi:hypothetical protein